MTITGKQKGDLVLSEVRQGGVQGFRIFSSRNLPGGYRSGNSHYRLFPLFVLYFYAGVEFKTKRGWNLDAVICLVVIIPLLDYQVF